MIIITSKLLKMPLISLSTLEQRLNIDCFGMELTTDENVIGMGSIRYSESEPANVTAHFTDPTPISLVCACVPAS